MTNMELLASVIVLLDKISVSGSENMVRMIDAIQRLNSLVEGLKKDKTAHEKAIAELERQLAERPRVEFHEDGSVTLGGEVIRREGDEGC